jgi:hypothetical protein
MTSTASHPAPATVGQLRESGWTSVPVKEELRRNAIERIQAGEVLFPVLVQGYEDTVLPQLENALLAGHDVIFLGERGGAPVERGDEAAEPVPLVEADLPGRRHDGGAVAPEPAAPVVDGHQAVLEGGGRPGPGGEEEDGEEHAKGFHTSSSRSAGQDQEPDRALRRSRAPDAFGAGDVVGKLVGGDGLEPPTLSV